MSEDYEVVKLGNKDYIILDEIEQYVYLSNILDENDFCIRKSVKNGDEEIFQGLNEEELKNALKLFDEKN